MKQQLALLIIDMQKGSFTEKTPRYNAAAVVDRINQLSQVFRASDLPVIFVQHDASGFNEFIPNTPEWELLDNLIVNPNDILVDKYANDVFYHSRLQEILNELKIQELVITGCATDFCVASTIQSALTKDYNITVVEDGHTTGERPHLNAEKIIEHYNWVWKNMIPTKGKIQVQNFQQIKEKIAGKIN